jgi:hypothetical protein
MHRRAHGVVVSRLLRMQKALGSNPSGSTFADPALWNDLRSDRHDSGWHLKLRFPYLHRARLDGGSQRVLKVSLPEWLRGWT